MVAASNPVSRVVSIALEKEYAGRNAQDTLCRIAAVRFHTGKSTPVITDVRQEAAAWAASMALDVMSATRYDSF